MAYLRAIHINKYLHIFHEYQLINSSFKQIGKQAEDGSDISNQ